MCCRNSPNLISNALKCVGGWGSAPDPAGGAYDAPPNPLVGMGFAPSALANRYFLANHILLAQIYPPNSIFLESPMVLSNALTPFPRHFVPRFRTFGTSIVWAPYLFLGNSTTAYKRVNSFSHQYCEEETSGTQFDEESFPR